MPGPPHAAAPAMGEARVKSCTRREADAPLGQAGAGSGQEVSGSGGAPANELPCAQLRRATGGATAAPAADAA
jgi:hypothetical protein